MNQRFENGAKTWDENPVRVKLAQIVAAAILDRVPVTSEMDAMDYGCGTGLVTLALQPHVRSIVGVDTSPGMLAVLDEKTAAGGLTNVRTILLDPEQTALPDVTFDLIASSTTMHHIKDVSELMTAFHGALRSGGCLCIADLDKEDGTFHSDPTGIEHFGFEQEKMAEWFDEAGFGSVETSTVVDFTRPAQDGTLGEYSIFLTVGRKG